MLNVDYFMMVEPIVQNANASDLGDQILVIKIIPYLNPIWTSMEFPLINFIIH